MAYKYDIVGSFYDRYAKGNKYKKEELIKIPGVTFNSLKDIDSFTASMTKFSFEEMVRDDYNDKNHFSIRVTDSKDKTFYRSIIFGNKELVELISSIKKKTIKSPNGPRTIDYITGNNKLLSDLWYEVEKLVESKDMNIINNTFDNNYAFIIRRYIESDTNESTEDYAMIREWFREYNVFRKYLTNKDKYFVSNINIKPSNYVKPMEIKSSNTGYMSYIKDREKDYALEDDKEEFFDEKEIGMMAGDGDVPHHFTGRKI